MYYVGIDVAKDKHDCIITDSNGKIVVPCFSITNELTGFQQLYHTILSCTSDLNCIKIGLEATGHYSNNILAFLNKHHLQIFFINPLQTCLYRKSQSFRKAKTDKIDALLITDLLQKEVLQPYIPDSDDIVQLRTLTRYRFSLVQDCSHLKVSTNRLITILFPELQSYVSDLSGNTSLMLMFNYPNAQAIGQCHLTKLYNLLSKAAKGHLSKDTCIAIRESARNSIGSTNVTLSFELQQTIQRIRLYESQINEVETIIKDIVIRLNSPILTIRGISYTLAGMILGEIGTFTKFSSAEKVLAYAGLEPSIYQSGHYESSHAKMVKRGSKYLRYALFTAAKCVCRFNSEFDDFLKQKQKEGKPYKVSISHVAKKLTRVIYFLETHHVPYESRS